MKPLLKQTLLNMAIIHLTIFITLVPVGLRIPYPDHFGAIGFIWFMAFGIFLLPSIFVSFVFATFQNK